MYNLIILQFGLKKQSFNYFYVIIFNSKNVIIFKQIIRFNIYNYRDNS